MLHVSLFGEQVITDDATGTVATRSPRATALVGFLVVHAGVPQSRQRIAEMFWPDSTDAQALTNLRRELHHLRQVLGAESALQVTSKDLCWRDTDTCRVDVRTFAAERSAALAATDADTSAGHAATAIATYQREFLPGLYDDWVLDARSELEQQCVELCDLVSAGPSPGAAVHAARKRIQLRPLEEGGYRTLMRLQTDLGERASAISTYHHCASILESELGITPDERTQAAARKLMSLAPPSRSGSATKTFVGRTAEWATLRSLWDSASTGKAAVALVRGSAGVGKTRLVGEIADAARGAGALVAGAQCFGTSGRLALGPVAEWLRHPAVQTTLPRLDPVWRHEVERLVPSAGSRGSQATAMHAMVDAWQRHRFFEGLARALIGTERPMMLVLDNIHWCDDETLAFLTYFLRLAPDAPILIAATMREELVGTRAPLDEWIATMSSTGILADVALGPLDADETVRLAEAVSGRALDDDARALLQATTGGFPLYVVEAARTSSEDPTPIGDLAAVLRNRLARGSATARATAQLAAAVGRNFTLALLVEASDLDTDDVVQAVDELWQRRIIHEVGDGYDFSHDLLRDAAYREISPPKRWLLHRRIAQGLELLHEGGTDRVSAELAEQYAKGGRPDRAVAYYGRAADVASATFAHAESVRLHREALKIIRAQPESLDTAAHELAVLEAMAAPLNALYGFSSEELQHALERSIEIAEMLGRKESTAWARVGLWATRFVQGNTSSAHALAARALSAITPESELSGSVHFTFAGSALSLGRPAEALRHFELGAELNRGAPMWSVGTRPDVHGTAWAAHAHLLMGDDIAALVTARDAIALARDMGHPFNLAVALAYAAITFQIHDDPEELREVLDELGTICGRYGFAYYREWWLILDGWSAKDEAGLDRIRTGIDNLKAVGAFARMPYWLSLLADAAERIGKPQIARATLDAALVAGRSRNDLWWLPEVMRMRARYDDPDAAVARLHAAAQMASEHGSVALLRRLENDPNALRTLRS